MSTITKWDKLASSRTVSVKSFVSGLSKLNTIGTKPRLRSFSRNRSRTAIRPSVNRPSRSTPFLSDGVDNVANFLVVEQEIDELRDLDVVDGDLGLVRNDIGDDQVLLLGPVQLQTPCGYPVDVAAGEIRLRKVRLD